MKQVILAILLLVAVAVVADDGLLEVFIDAPGTGGMHSTIDGTQLQPDQAQYLKNVDVTGKPGALRQRTRIVPWGTSTIRIDGAAEYWNPLYGDLGLFSIGYLTATFLYTDTNPDSVATMTVSTVLKPDTGAAHNFASGDGFLVHCDGLNPPVVFTSRNYADSSDHNDMAYKPRVLPLGLEAPGEPIVRLKEVDSNGVAPGSYQYAFQFLSCTPHSDYTAGVGGLGPLSRVVEVTDTNKMVVLTGFEHYPHYSCTTTTIAVLCRDTSKHNLWDSLGFVTFDSSDHYGLTYVDSLGPAATFTGIVDPSTATTIARPVPGAMHYADSSDFVSVGDSLVAIRCSYYDPILGIESPLGPVLWTDTGEALDVIPLKPDTSVRPTVIRVYQSADSDTGVVYGVLERPFYNFVGQFTVDGWSPDSLAAGLNPDSYDSLFENEQLWSASGDVISRPPYEYANQIEFSDMCFVDDRFWGIGGLYKNRVYYSSPYDVGRWNPDSSVIALDEEINDEIVAIEPANGLFKDHLYAIKRNSVYMIVGAIADYGFDVSGNTPYPFRKITNGIGAVSNNAVENHRGVVYFLSPDIRAYAIIGQEVREIGRQVKDRLDSTFTSYSAAANYARVMSMQDGVMFVNTNTGNILTYNTVSGTWSAEDYKLRRNVTLSPIGVVTYDANSSTRGFDWYSDLMFFDTAIGLYERDRDERVDSTSGFEYRSPLLGDGKRNWSVLELQMTVDVNSTTRLHYSVLNQDNDELWDSKSLVYTTSNGDVRLHFPVDHFGKYLAVKVYTLASDSLDGTPLTNDITIHDMRLLLRTAGRVTVSPNEVRIDSTWGDTSTHVPGS